MVKPGIHLCRRSMKGIIVSPNFGKFNDLPVGDQYLAIKAIMGDPGDNIRSLKGIGEMKAKKTIGYNPRIIEQCFDDPHLVDWDDFDKNLRRAFARAGRLHVFPSNLIDPTFAIAFARERGMPTPKDYDIPEEECLAQAAFEIARCMHLVEMDTNIDYGGLQWPKPDVDAVWRDLVKLELDSERNLGMAIEHLMGLVSIVRNDEGESPPEDLF